MNMTKERELLKEAAEFIENLRYPFLVQSDQAYNTTTAIKAKDFIDKINAYLSQPDAVAMSWEEALDKIASTVGYEYWSDLILREPLEDILTYCGAAHLFMESNRVQRWIPVEERLPEEGLKGLERNKLCLYKETNGKLIPAICSYVRPFEVVVEDFDGDAYLDQDPNKGESYIKEGWYEECEQHGSEYDSYYIKRNVVLWQPLPEVPEVYLEGNK